MLAEEDIEALILRGWMSEQEAEALRRSVVVMPRKELLRILRGRGKKSQKEFYLLFGILSVFLADLLLVTTK